MFSRLTSDPEKPPLQCGICFCGETEYTRYSDTWGAEGQVVAMYFCHTTEMIICEYCKYLIDRPRKSVLVHDWKEQGF